jgi:hypothetical protein
MTAFDLDYVVVPETMMEPAVELVAGFAARLSGVGPIVVCRRIHDGTPLAALPAPADEIGGRPVEETWSTSLAWLERALAAGLADAVAARLIVRVPWPIGLADEMTLLAAKLSTPSVRLAVEITPATADEVFHYLNRLEQDWIAVPARPEPACAEAMARLGRLWLFDPRTRTSMEPVVNALGPVLRSAIGHDEPAWRLHVAEAGEGFRRAAVGWTPSLHALLRARGTPLDRDDLESVAAFDGQWIDALKDLCTSVDADAVRALAAASVAGRSTS